MKVVIFLFAFIAVAMCQLLPVVSLADCANTTTINTADAWSSAYTIPDSLYVCFSVNGTNPDSTENNTLVLAARFDADSPNTNTTNLAVWDNLGNGFGNVSLGTEDDVDSICVINLNTSSAVVNGVVTFVVQGVSANTTFDLWADFSTDPSCGAGADVSGGGGFWIWIVVAVVIVVIIAVIIAGAGAFVYYQKKKKDLEMEEDKVREKWDRYI